MALLSACSSPDEAQVRADALKVVGGQVGLTPGQLRVTSLILHDGWSDGREYFLIAERPCSPAAGACSPQAFTVELSYQRRGELWEMISSQVQQSAR
ncbi:hypothetical protein ACFODL_09065 [Phenylobacterium terrae]|uniref:Lipoprotein n=1 Tax=Phenylobacterium terrae TaxID=2665495 RepID=A0ABW4N5H8_9CAUL